MGVTWDSTALEQFREKMGQAEKNYDPGAPPEEYPVGTWLRDRHGAVTKRQSDGYGAPGTMPFGRWSAMWSQRGPLVPCSAWGSEERHAEAIEKGQLKVERAERGLRLSIEVSLETDFFEEDFEGNLRRVLHEVAEQMVSGYLLDGGEVLGNGTPVATWSLT